MVAAMLGMMVYFINAVCLCIVLGFLSARYRDGIQIIQSLMNILIFMTPIMWRKEMLGDKQILADVNPFTHFIDIIRAPLLGLELSTLSIIYVLLFTIVNIMSASYLYRKFKNRLVFWL
jgi:ABC-2 type transport system permease protein/lipopolysaccharide transport system permease protein